MGLMERATSILLSYLVIAVIVFMVYLAKKYSIFFLAAMPPLLILLVMSAYLTVWAFTGNRP